MTFCWRWDLILTQIRKCKKQSLLEKSIIIIFNNNLLLNTSWNRHINRHYIHIYKHVYKHVYIHTYIHTYIHSYMQLPMISVTKNHPTLPMMTFSGAVNNHHHQNQLHVFFCWSIRKIKTLDLCIYLTGSSRSSYYFAS